ncbi:hypothetical protein Taro_025170 [Colocasia esculenta]|uniref:J domain-containing protein n=1 Tax=Colocasia esculenta TaxID=4460 RepID=A0A843VBI1_COLES|nr:hypothetical protein [Colocasia esculenta]
MYLRLRRTTRTKRGEVGRDRGKFPWCEIVDSSFGRGKSTGAYQRLARACHPEAAGGSREGASANEFMRVHAAYARSLTPTSAPSTTAEWLSAGGALPPIYMCDSMHQGLPQVRSSSDQISTT